MVSATTSIEADYPNLIEVELVGEGGGFEVAGSLFHEREARIVRLQSYPLEFEPKGHLLVMRNDDVPGVVGKLGQTLGDAGVNIAAIHLARRHGGHQAMAVLRLDQEPPAAALEALRSLSEVEAAEVVDVGPL